MAMNGEMAPLNEMAPIMLAEGRRHAIALVDRVRGHRAGRARRRHPVAEELHASTTILAQKSDIIQPLLEGRAVSTGVADRVSIAKQVIFSRKV